MTESRFQTLAQLLAGTVIACLCQSAAAEQISLAPEVWEIRFSYDLPNRPYAHGSGWAFDFPKGTNCTVKKGCPGVHYITTNYTKSIPTDSILPTPSRSSRQSTVFNFKLEDENTCKGLRHRCVPFFSAQVTIFKRTIASGRTSLCHLAPGEYTMKVELSPDQWTNVEGERSASGFADMLKNMGNIGVTFGGGCFFGHGVNVSGGTARFMMIRFELKP